MRPCTSKNAFLAYTLDWQLDWYRMSGWKQFPLGVVKAPLSASRTVPEPVVNEGHFLSRNSEELLMSPWAPEFHGLCFVVGLFSLIEPEACVPFTEESSVLLVQEFSCIFFFSSGNFFCFIFPGLYSQSSCYLAVGSFGQSLILLFFLHGFVVPETSLTLL